MTPEQLAAAGTEHAHQVALMAWIALTKQWFPAMDKIFAVPNGGERNLIVASRLKAEGVKAGVPDLCLPYPVKPFHGLFIEMKKPKGKGASDDQLKRLGELQMDGYAACICFGYEEAANALVIYLTGLGKPCTVPFPNARKSFLFGGV